MWRGLHDKSSLYTRGEIRAHESHPIIISGLLYWPKWLWYSVAIKTWQMSSPKRLNNYDPNSRSYEHCGVVPSQTDHKLEDSKTLITDRVNHLSSNIKVELLTL